MLFLYAFICFISVTQGILLLEHISLAMYSIMSISGTLAGSTLFGVIALGETITLKLLLAIGFIILSVVLPMFESNNSKQKQSIKILLIYIYLFVYCTISAAIGTIYLAIPINPIQYYTQTNLILFLACLITLPLAVKHTHIKKIIKIFNLKQIGSIAGKSGITFFSTLITLKILTMVSVAINSVISNALSLIAATLVSIIICRQKPSLLQIISLIFVVTATALCSL